MPTIDLKLFLAVHGGTVGFWPALLIGGLLLVELRGKIKLCESEGRQAERREEKDRREHVLKKHTAELEKGVGAER